MQKDRKAFLENLLCAASPTGCESFAAGIYKKRLKKIADEITSDMVGNTSAFLKPAKSAGMIMLAGHIDEIGVMVRYIDEKGFIYFAAVGGLDSAILPGKRVVFHKNTEKPVRGVIGRKPIHLLEVKEREKAVSMDDLFIDIGAKDGKNAEKLLSVGDCGVIDMNVDYLSDDIAVARGFDDRIGAFIIAETMIELSKKKSSLKYTVCATATTQEEIGLRGAGIAAFNLKPDLAIAIDVTHAIDYPDVSKKKFGDISLGKGGCIVKGPNIHPLISQGLTDTAKKKKIPYQIIGNPRPTGTDANIIQITRGGIPASLVSVPLRYMHTPSEMLSLKDVENIIQLLTEYILTLQKKIDFSL